MGQDRVFQKAGRTPRHAIQPKNGVQAASVRCPKRPLRRYKTSQPGATVAIGVGVSLGLAFRLLDRQQEPGIQEDQLLEL